MSTTTATTAISAGGICIDADGDGWGWNGGESCMVDTVNIVNTLQDISCIDTENVDPESTDTLACPDEPATPTDSAAPEPITCIDTDGDGWGWTGTESCIP